MGDDKKREVLRASDGMETNTIAFAKFDASCPFVKALLALKSAATSVFSGETRDRAIYSQKSLSSPFGSPFCRREISRLAPSISSEINSWMHHESLQQLVTLLRSPSSSDEEETIRLLVVFECVVSRGFDRGLQDAILFYGVLPAVESALTSRDATDRVRDLCAEVVLSLVLFNKDVFVGEVVMSPSAGCLVSMGSAAALYSLAGLVAAIRSPLVDELLAHGDIPRILAFLTSPELEIRVLAFECVVEIGYFGRKNAVEALMESGVVERLMELQRSNLGIGEEKRERVKTEVAERRPFASAVARFAVGVEVGEGLRQREKRAFKLEVLRLAREASSDEAEAATVAGEILWGSTSW